MANENPGQGQNEGGGITLESIKSAGVPDSYLKDGAYDFGSISKDLGELTTFRTQAAERTKNIPEKYEFSIPKNWQKPEGFTDEMLKGWKVSEHKIGAFTPLAKELGLSQAQMEKFVSAWATADFAEKFAAEKAESEAFAKEVAALGANGDARLKAAESALVAKGFKALIDPQASFKDRLEAIERLANDPQRQASKGNGNGADMKPDTSKMTARQKLDYANEQAMRKH